MSEDRIIVTSGQPHFIPAIKLLAAKDFKFMSLDQTFAKTLADLDLPAAPISQATDGLQDAAIAETLKILNAAQRPMNGKGIPEPIKRFIENGLPIYLYTRIADLAMLVLALDRVKPEVVMVHNDIEPVLRCVALWAKQNNVPCLHIPHAIYQDVNRGGPGTDVHDIVTASHLASAGSVQTMWYKLRGFPPQNIRETGMPQFDEWARMTMDRRKARQLLKFDNNRPVVVYASTWPQATNLAGIHDEWAVSYLRFLEAMKAMPEIQPIVKLHPRAGQDNFSWHAQKAKEAGVECHLTAIHNQIIFSAVDLVIAYGGSNVLLEAAHVPGVRLMSTHGYFNDPEIEKIVMDEMAEAIQSSLSRPAPDTLSFRFKYLGIPDGRASERIAAFIEELANAKNKVQRQPKPGKRSRSVPQELQQVP